jgi:hypothetical protein
MNLQQKIYVKPLATFLSIATLLMAVSISPISALPGNGSVVGMVFAENFSTPIVGAVVKLYDPKTEKFYSGRPTDEYGLYAINNVPVGEYNVVVSTKKGDFPSDMMVVVRADLPTPLSLSLKPGKKAPDNPEKKKKWYKRPLGILIIIGAAAGAGYGIYKAVASPEKS